MSISRRNFLRSAAAGVSLHWGGLRIFAGSRNGPVGAQGLPPTGPAKQFVYGTQFFRPPNPPRAQRRDMLKAIAQDYGFNIVRVYPSWDYVNPAAEEFVFDEVEEVMECCDEFGLKVLMGLMLEIAPWWLEQAHPETRYVDAKGQALRLHGNASSVTGGYPGLCIDWEPVRQAGARYIHELVKVVSPHPALYAYDCWNEPHIEPAWAANIWATPQETLFCYCPKTIEKFRLWLQRRYGALDGLNEAWTRRYPNWETVNPPDWMATTADWVDWRRYIIERSTEEMRFRVETARAVDPHHIFESHAGHHPPIEATAVLGTNGWRLAELLDVWGTSLFPRWFNIEPYVGAAKFEIIRSNAAGKEFWLTELQGGHGMDGLWRSPEVRPRDIRLWNWMAVATGAKGIVYWNYLAEATGREATGYGLVTRSGAPTERVEEAARNNQLIQAHWDIIKDYQPRPQVAILTDQDNAILTYAIAGNEDASTASFTGYYKALWNLDLWVDFIEPTSLGRAPYKVLIAPWHLIGKEETCEHLRRYVEAGGTLILETAFGMFDERFYYNPVIPPHGLDAVFGYREKESYSVNRATAGTPLGGPGGPPPSDRIYSEPEIEFSDPIPIRAKAHTYVTPLEITSAKPIAKCGEFTVASTKQVGKGRVYYFGTNLGASIAAGDNAGIELLRSIVSPVLRPPVTSEKVRPRLIEGRNRSLLVIFNDTGEDQKARLELPRRFRRARDIHNGTELPCDGHTLGVTVPHEDAVVLLLE